METIIEAGVWSHILRLSYLSCFLYIYSDNGSKMGKKYSELSPAAREKKSTRVNTTIAVRQGKIEKKCCQRCGAKEAEAHHTDYTDRNMVLWLCPKCHRNIHKVYEQYHAILPKFKAHLELSFVMGERLI